MAMTIFAVVATALAGVLTSSISARSIASERTAAEQDRERPARVDQVMDYADVGLTDDGNPPGDRRRRTATRRPRAARRLPRSVHGRDRDHLGGRRGADELRDQGELQERDRHRLPCPRLQAAGAAEHPGRPAPEGGPRRDQQGDRQRPGERLLPQTRRSRTSSSTSTTGRAPLSPTRRTPPARHGSRRSIRRPARPTTTSSCRPSTATSCCRIRAPRTSSSPPGRRHRRRSCRCTSRSRYLAGFNNSNGPPFVGTVVFTGRELRGLEELHVHRNAGRPSRRSRTPTTGASSCSCPGTYTITVTNSAACPVLDPTFVTQDVPVDLSELSGAPRRGGTTSTADPLGTISATVTLGRRPGGRSDGHRHRRAAVDPDAIGDDESSGIANVPQSSGRLRLHGDGSEGRPERAEPVGLGQRRIDDATSRSTSRSAPEGRRHLGRRQGRRRDRDAHRRPDRRLTLGNVRRQRRVRCSRTSRPARATR